jgi:hypothetical protein
MKMKVENLLQVEAGRQESLTYNPSVSTTNTPIPAFSWEHRLLDEVSSTSKQQDPRTSSAADTIKTTSILATQIYPKISQPIKKR